MGPRHFAAYEDSVFRHYVQFGPPGVDLPTFEHILSQWDKKSKKFVFTDRNDGEEIPCSFNLEWVMEHTWFSNEGLHVDHNRDRKNRIWSRFFDKPEAGGSSSIAPPKGGPTRRNVEDLLLKLLWYYELTGIKKPALGCTAWEDHFNERINRFRAGEYKWLSKFLYAFSFNMTALSSSSSVIAALCFGVSGRRAAPPPPPPRLIPHTPSSACRRDPLRTVPPGPVISSPRPLNLSREGSTP
ncbi:uncharacterized protein A4U43_C02F21190 [Asparagus officinalis]|uniref:Uncharacterized protein n=1 Tax=Asparagus officinalis TaxID=4686 RepID=A0A5P1FMN3_ASPOF|nr:uncharacterized protein A4U43_C02F21190 [Asparagus officinalis]